MANDGVNPNLSRMWHLNHDPYNRAIKGEPKSYVPVRNSYTPLANSDPASSSNLDRNLTQSLDAVDDATSRSQRANGRPSGPRKTRSSDLNDNQSAGSSDGRPPVPSSSRPTRPNIRPSRPSKRAAGARNSGQWRAPGASTTQNDFVFFSPNKPLPAGLSPRNKAVPEEDDDDDEDEEEHKQRERKPFIADSTNDMGRKCRDCMTRVPYATLIATVMCCVGVGVFCGTMYRGTTLTLRLFEDVFKLHIKWDREYRVEPVQLTFMVVGAGMGGLGLMILFVGCLSTGDTRNKVYKTWRGRVGGRISCAIFMGITYLLSLAWLLMFAALIIVTLFYTLAWFQCQYIPQNECINYNQFSFLFPKGTPEEDKNVCTGERKLFCKDYVNNAEIMFILASVSAFLVILSLVHYLMCLAANYAHIKDQEKFMDLQEIQFLHESEMSTLPKDRF